MSPSTHSHPGNPNELSPYKSGALPLDTSTASKEQPFEFVALTLHVATHSPAPGAKIASKGKIPGISRVPRGPGEGEDCTCVVLVPGKPASEHSVEAVSGENDADGVSGRWAMIESVGRWDARFG